jgi:hypothetical protein
MMQSKPDRRRVRRHIAGIATAMCLAVLSAVNNRAVAHESFATAPSTRLVSDFFGDISKIIFLDQFSGTPAMQMTALRNILARSTDADAISRFILGRYATGPQPASVPAVSPTEAFLNFATTAMMRMAPHHHSASGQAAGPALAIITMTMRSDQTRLVQSELILPNGRSLPLTWEIADRPTGLRIEDVNCLGISLRLMLRSAVAEAAAEHPEDGHDLGRLLGSDPALAQFSGASGLP